MVPVFGFAGQVAHRKFAYLRLPALFAAVALGAKVTGTGAADSIAIAPAGMPKIGDRDQIETL